MIRLMDSGAAVFTNNLSKAQRLIKAIKAGSVFVNSPVRIDPNLPFGGYKQSGYGREHGTSIIDTYTELKSVVIGYQYRGLMMIMLCDTRGEDILRPYDKIINIKISIPESEYKLLNYRATQDKRQFRKIQMIDRA